MVDAETVHLWEIFLDGPDDDDEAWAVILPAEELSIGTQRRLGADRLRYLRSHVALRTILAAYIGPEAARRSFLQEEKGKPRLNWTDLSTPEANLEFNLAHSGSWGVVAIGMAPVGIDVELLRPLSDLDAMIARCCSPNERQRIGEAPVADRIGRFFECWTAKEALLKGVGCGIAADLHQIETPVRQPLQLHLESALLSTDGSPTAWRLAWFDIDANHLGAIAVGPQVNRIVKKRFSTL